MIIGIDLGTTNSLAAVWRDGTIELIPNALGSVLTPSAVSLDRDNGIMVGIAARERLVSHPDRSVAAFKRAMGTAHAFRLGNQTFRAEELSLLVLRALKEDAERHLGAAVTDAVITVPAHFSDAQRKATRAAGRLAGLNVVRLLNEPMALSDHLLAQLVFDRTLNVETIIEAATRLGWYGEAETDRRSPLLDRLAARIAAERWLAALRLTAASYRYYQVRRQWIP